MIVTFGGQDWRPVQTCSLEDQPPELTSRGYGSEAGSPHPTEKLFYCPQMKFAKLMFLQVSVCPQGGMHGRGSCVVGGGGGGCAKQAGHAWWGVHGGMHGRGGHVW